MKNKKQLVKSSLLVMITVLFGKMLGFVKQSVIAWKFGTSSALDVYYSADSFVCLIAQTLLLSIPPAIVTIILKIKDKDSELEKEKFINSVFTFFIVASFALAIVNCLLSPIMPKILGISYDINQQSILTKYLIFLSPTIIFASLSAVSSGFLQSKNKFVQDKLMGIFFSISIILCTIFLGSKIQVNALLIGFVAGYFLFFVFMMILFFKNVHIKLVNPLKNKHFVKYLKILLPIIIGISVVDISHLIDKIIASSLESGSVSILYYSQIICGDLVNGIIIASIGLVLLPKITMEIKEKESKDIVKDINNILSISVPILILITTLYIAVGKNIISLVFERGVFTEESTNLVFKSVFFYSLGLPFIMIKEIALKYLYAMEDGATTMKANIISILVNIFLSIVLSRYLGCSGIALATTISLAFTNFILFSGIKKRINVERIINRDCILDVFKSIVTLSILLVLGLFMNKVIINSIISLIVIGLLTIVLFIITIKALDTRLYKEISQFYNDFIKKFKQNKKRNEECI